MMTSSTVILLLGFIALSQGYIIPLESEIVQVEPHYVEEYNYLNSAITSEILKREKRQPQLDVNVNHGQMGTALDAALQGRMWESRNGRTTLDGGAFYNQHFGGMMGTGRPNYGANIHFVHRF